MTDTNSSKELNARGYLAAYFYRVPKKNHNAISQNLKKFIPWFVSNGVRLEYYHLAGKDTQETIEAANASGIYIMADITKTLAAEDEDIWMELQYFRAQNHNKEVVYAKMMSDKRLEPLGKEFMGLISTVETLSRVYLIVSNNSNPNIYNILITIFEPVHM